MALALVNRCRWALVALPLLVVAAACSGSSANEFGGVANDKAPTNPAGPNKDPDAGPTTTGTPVAKVCKNKDKVDHDGDGISFEDGDCDDCNAEIFPGAIDVPGNGIDEDCSGQADDPPPENPACDNGTLVLASSDALDAARSIGLCKKAGASPNDWGVVSARYVRPDGVTLTDTMSYGLLPNFGANAPQDGKSMLALSSGAARATDQPGHVSGNSHSKGYTHAMPPGFPKASVTGCPGVVPSTTAHDGAALELKVRVPANAHSMSFLHNLFTWEYSVYVCSQYADTFAVTMNPPPPGIADGNIVVDAQKEPLGVNAPSLLQICAPGTHKGITFTCPLGEAPLQGTGFEGHAATGWLKTTTPVTPSTEITLLFSIWDAGDGVLDSTVLIDNLVFSPDVVGAVVTTPK